MRKRERNGGTRERPRVRICVDEASFDFKKRRRRQRNIIGRIGTVDAQARSELRHVCAHIGEWLGAAQG